MENLMNKKHIDIYRSTISVNQAIHCERKR